jgi:hypothetical protein
MLGLIPVDGYLLVRFSAKDPVTKHNSLQPVQERMPTGP